MTSPLRKLNHNYKHCYKGNSITLNTNYAKHCLLAMRGLEIIPLIYNLPCNHGLESVNSQSKTK